MYGLPQAGIIVNKLLTKRLAPYSYYQCRHTPGLWRHTNRTTKLCLFVDDFMIQYTGQEHAKHLINILQNYYESVSLDWDATLSCGVTLKWDYRKRTCETSMPGYIPALLKRFGHPTPKRTQYAPHKHNVPQYGVKIQFTDPIDHSPKLSPPQVKTIQKQVGTLLYYCRAIDNTLMVALSNISSEKIRATDKTQQAIHQLIDYCATNPNAIVRFHACDMRLKIHSDTGYFNAAGSRSRAGGHFYLQNNDNKPDTKNGAILNPNGILRHIASSEAKDEL